MEYADGGDIFQLIKEHQKSGKLIDEDDIWRIFIQAVRGLKALHDIKIIHRDLKVRFLFILRCSARIYFSWRTSRPSLAT